MDITARADADRSRLEANSYPGRILLLGMNAAGTHLIEISAIMGRGADSRNRVYKQDAYGRLYTAAANPATLKNPHNIIYDAMMEHGGFYYVSNGIQTRALCEKRGGLYYTLMNWKYEDDKPHFTPRISGLIIKEKNPSAQLSLIKKSSFSDACERFFWNFEHLERGYGYCLHTYMGDGNPLPPFQGKPLLLPLDGDGPKIAKDFWALLNADNRVALAVKSVRIHSGESEIHIINKYEEVA